MRRLIVVSDVFGILLTTTVMLIEGFFLSTSGIVLLSVPMFLVWTAIAIAFRRQFVRMLWMLLKNPAYGIANMFLPPLLSTYAMWNINDVSWGTRGLTRMTGDVMFRRRINRMRNVAVLSWIAFNTTLAVAALRPGLISPQLNPLVEAASVAVSLVAGTAVVSLLGRSMSQWKRSSMSWFGRLRSVDPING